MNSCFTDCGAASPMKHNNTKTTMAAGNASLRLAAILSRMLQPCVPVAAIVVSEITDRLSPNIAPPKTVPATSGKLSPAASDMPMCMGTTVEMVPIDVPMENDTKHEIKNKPG